MHNTENLTVSNISMMLEIPGSVTFRNVINLFALLKKPFQVATKSFVEAQQNEEKRLIIDEKLDNHSFRSTIKKLVDEYTKQQIQFQQLIHTIYVHVQDLQKCIMQA